jgi:hypothetical protein
VDAIVGSLRRIVQPFKVATNAKGGDFCHVYRQSVLFIEGKNNNDDGRFTNRVYMERTTVSNEDTEEQAMKTHNNKVEKLRRNSAMLHAEHKWVLGPR